MEKVRAGRMVGVGQMRCDEFEPRPPGDGELLVRTTYGSICGSDLHVVCHGVDAPQDFPTHHGFPGHEGVGEVVESRAAGFAAGDRVLTVPNARVGTCFAEIQTLPAAYCLPLPATDVPERELLMAQQLGTVVFALKKNPVDVEGKTVVVIGQGSAGLFFTHLFRAAGAETIITSDLAARRMQVSADYGADQVVANVGDDLWGAVMDATRGVGADHVVEAVGRSETLAESIDLVRPDGTMLWFGLPDDEKPVPISFRNFFRKRLSAWSVYGAQDEPGLASFATAAEMIAAGDIDMKPIVSHVLPVDEIQAAFEMANEPDADDAVKVSVSF